MKNIITIRNIYLLLIISVWSVSLIRIVFIKDKPSFAMSISQPEMVPIYNKFSEIEGFEKFDSYIKRSLNKWQVNGASVAVMKNNKLIYAKGYGFANKEDSIVVEPYNVFRLASMSKLITGVAIMKMVDNGDIKLTDKVFGEGGLLSKKYPEYKDKRANKITVEHLLRHEGGFTTPVGDPMFKLELIEKGLGISRPLKQEDYINYAMSRRLGYTPGTSHKYSNIGYMILSAIIEEVTGEDYYEYIEEEILEPIGCNSTKKAHNMFEDKYNNEVKYYSTTKEDFIEGFDGSGVIYPKPYGGNDVTAMKGAGGWVSTTHDMLLIAMAIDGKNGKNDVKDILSSKSVSKMQTSIKGRLPIGWAGNSNGYFERTGTFSGTSTIIKHDPNGISWIVLANTSSWIGYRLNNNFKSMMNYAVRYMPPVDKKRDLFDHNYLISISK